MADWIDACAIDDIGPEEVIRFDHESRSFIIVRDNEDNYFCADGFCTHEEDVHLCDGLVVDCTIECPKHSSVFDVSTGEVEMPPACDDLQIYPTKIMNSRVFVRV